jgi:hypothetical protein
MTAIILTYEQANKLLRYDPDTGNLYRLVSSGRVKAGSQVSGIDPKGYIQIKIEGKSYRGHRLAWLLTHKCWPSGEILHDNQNPSDNRIVNLSEGTHAQNMKNLKKSKANKSGIAGVWWCGKSNIWRAYININGKRKTLGGFKGFFDGCCARKSAENNHDFHYLHCQ